METIYYNGKIITMAETNGETAIANAPEAVVVKNGIITAVGTYAAISASLSRNAKPTQP